MKTAELIGAALDWAVAKCEFQDCPESIDIENGKLWTAWHHHDYSPSTDWAQGGLIIERERLCVMPFNDSWTCVTNGSHLQSHSMRGDAPLIAAMRCYVASKMGDTVNIPKEITE